MQYKLPLHTTFYWSKKKSLLLEGVSLAMPAQGDVPTCQILVDADEASENEALSLLSHWFDCYIEKKPLPKLPLNRRFSRFTEAVLTKTSQIPAGSTACYSDLAAMIGNPKAQRAVAQSLGSNPFPLIIPCHRVIGKDGSLRGFREGIEVKKALLEFESK